MCAGTEFNLQLSPTPGVDADSISLNGGAEAENADAPFPTVSSNVGSMSDADVRAAMEAAMIASQSNLSHAAARAKTMSLNSSHRKGRSVSDPRNGQRLDWNFPGDSPQTRSRSSSTEGGSG